MDSIYKTCFYNSSGNVSHIYVFCGDDTKTADQFFSRSEYNELVTKKVEIACVGLYIHPDDSIYDIKRKILYSCFERDMKQGNSTHSNPLFSIEEMYLFGIVEKKFDLLSFYRNLTDSEETSLNLSLLGQSLVNYQVNEESIDDEILSLYNDNEINKTFLYEDLQKMAFFYSENNLKKQKIPLGHRFYNTTEGNVKIQNADESFVVNPFDLWKKATINNKRKIQNFENDFLFHFGSLHNNTIFVATAEPVLEFLETQEIDVSQIMSMYYPSLQKLNITSKEDLIVEKQGLVENSRQKFYDMNLKTNFQTLSMFHTIFESKTQELPYEQRGIRDFFFILHPEDRAKKMPLENIFKHIHATVQVPFIQYNPGLRQENSYRIFYNETAQNGKKIPYLPKSVFSHFLKKMNRVQNICMFIDQRMLGDERTSSTIVADDFIQLLLQNNGDILIKGKLDAPLMPVEFNHFLTKLCEPALEMVNNFLQQSGYFIHNFQSIYDSFVEVVDMNFVCQIQMKELSFKKYMGCFSSLFYHEMQPMKNEGMRMRYKRVENFRNMSPEDDFIAGLLRITQDKKFIATQIKKAFPNKDPKSIMQEYESRHMAFLIPGRYVNKKIEMMENPGFQTVFKRFGKLYTIEMSGINLSQYLEVIPIYMDSILRMNVDPSVLTPEMVSLCKSKKISYDDEPRILTVEERPVEIFEEQKKEKGLLVEEADEDDEDDDGFVKKRDKKSSKEDGDGDDDDEDESVPDDYDYGLDDYDEEDEDEDEDKDGDEDEDKDGDDGEDKDGDEDEDKDGDEDNDDDDDDEDEDEDKNKKQEGGDTKKNERSGSDSESESDSDSELDDIQNVGEEKISSYWRKRIEQYDPVLFRVLKKGFTRLSQEEQPVIVTDEEMKQIDPTKYTHSLKYRRDKKGQPLHYICPRYWCTKPSMEGPISEEEAKSGKCGKIMNTDKDRGKKAPIGEYVIEYSGQNPEPGFVKSNKHQLKDENNQSVCATKCFKKWETKGQKESRVLCSPEFYAEEKKDLDKGQGKLVRPTDANIQESSSFPLSFGRAGKLPIPVQTFLSTNNELCVVNRKIKPNCSALLRYGPEPTLQGKQSFLACMSDIYSFERNKPNDPYSLSQFKEKIIESLTLDLYIQLHNGSIASLFQPKQIDSDDIQEVDVSPYKDSFFYSKMDTQDESQMSFFKHSILSYEKFKEFLRDEDITIDYTHLWEIISRPNPKLFVDGINLAILEMPEADNTNTVILLCPTHSYSFPLFDSKRKTVLLLKQTNENGTYYESIYRYKRSYHVVDGKRIETEDIKKQFSNKSRDLKGLSTVIQLIRNVTEGKCRPKKPVTYEFQHNKPVSEILNMFETNAGMKSMKIKSRVLNFQGKTIGLMVDWNDKPDEVVSKGPFYLPCYPSTTSDQSLEVLWMDNPDIWTDYYSTVSFLRHVYAVSSKEIPCDPKFRMISENRITGVLTNTNQFVQIDKPIENIAIGDGLKPLNGSNYVLSDKKLQTKSIVVNPNVGSISNGKSNAIPVPHEETQNIYLETQFYSVFRSTMRILLNIYRNRFKYRDILELHVDPTILFREKRKKVMEILQEIGEKNIVFQEYDQKVLNGIDEIYNCQGNCRNKKYCLYKEEDGQCVLLIPDKHLVSGQSNTRIYYMRLADELLRHKRIHLFMFYPDSYLNISNTEMKVANNEFVITDYEFRNNYFKDLEPFPLKNYARASTYETALPTTRTLPGEAKWIGEFEKADMDLRANK